MLPGHELDNRDIVYGMWCSRNDHRKTPQLASD